MFNQTICYLYYLGSKVYEKVAGILTKTQLLNDIKKLSNDAQTSCLEGYHATLNFWHPKIVCFSWMGTYCRYFMHNTFIVIIYNIVASFVKTTRVVHESMLL